MRTFVVAFSVLLGCSSGDDRCLVHSQCATGARCIEGHCVMPPPDAGEPEAGPVDAAAPSPDGSTWDLGGSDVQFDASFDGGSGGATDGGLADAHAVGEDVLTGDAAWRDHGHPGADLGLAPMDGGVADADAALARD